MPPSFEQAWSAALCHVPLPCCDCRHHHHHDYDLHATLCAAVPAVRAVQMYMLLIILLMLSQDSAFAQNIHKIRLPAVPFYKERSTATTLGSLLVVLLLR